MIQDGGVSNSLDWFPLDGMRILSGVNRAPEKFYLITTLAALLTRLSPYTFNLQLACFPTEIQFLAH